MLQMDFVKISFLSSVHATRGVSYSAGIDAWGGWSFSIGKNLIRISSNDPDGGSNEPV